jgi:type II secretory pathway pseudopilin PulG
VNSASTDPCPPLHDDAGFTLVEMVVALIIMFGALIASSQVIVSMVKATLYSRHADYAVTLASQVMEQAVTNDCGGRLPDNRANPLVRWNNQRDRCKYFATAPTYSVTPIQSRCRTATGTYFRGWSSSTIGEDDLGRRYFVREQGAIAYCVSFDVQWVPLTWNANAVGTSNLRLQRTVRVQWVEPNKPNEVRERVSIQIAALPPDSVQTSYVGRVDVYVGPTVGNGPPNSVSVAVPPVATRAAGDPVSYMTISADGNGWVHIPYVPTDVVTSPSAGVVTVTPSYTLDVRIGTRVHRATLSSTSPNACAVASTADLAPVGGTAFVSPSSAPPVTGVACS